MERRRLEGSEERHLPPEQARKCGVSLVCLDCASRDCAVVQQDLHRFPGRGEAEEVRWRRR